MKKIKIVVSDLHLGRGRLLDDGSLNSLEEFHFEDKFSEFLSYYSSGSFADMDIELVLNGDILNFLQVDYRGHFLTVLTEPICMELLEEIVRGHPKFFKSLREFAQRPNRSLTYIVGNHDQAMLWPMVRERLNEILETSVKYKNIVYFFDGVHIEHGHMHEAANRLDPKRFFLKKDIAEPILNLPFGSHFFIDFVMKIKRKYPYVDKIRPFRRMVRWALFNETAFSIKGFFSLFSYFVRSAFVKDPRRHWTLRGLVRIAFENAIFPDLSEAARRILTDERVHTVIFGHSHVYNYRQWPNGGEYFNTGTWTEVTSLDIPSLGRITKLTYVFIEYPEDAGRPRARLKEWRGFHRIEEDVAVS